jgi:AmmeMemoRadiSam system protein A
MSKLSENSAASDPTHRERHSPESSPEKSSHEHVSPEHFSPEQRKLLLAIAHEAIAAKIAGEKIAEAKIVGKALAGAAAWRPESPSVDSPNRAAISLAALEQPRGVFTTLYLRGQLRGCVGYAAAVRPLVQAVAETACAAAFEDSRFAPVSREEAPQLKISLSVLSPLFPIDAARVQVGRHGLAVSEDSISGTPLFHTPKRGLLLPQVPVEHGWDRETFLEQTCRKAGMALDAWKSKSVVIEAFTAEVFGDELPGDVFGDDEAAG